MNSFATSTKSIESVTDLWAWRLDNELERAAAEVERSHVLILLAREKDLSGVAVVAGLTSNNSRILTALGRRHSWPLGRDSTSSSMSRKQSGWFRLSEYGSKYVGFYCWKSIDIDFCTIICLEVRGFYGYIFGCNGFDRKGFQIFVSLKTRLLEPFKNRKNHVIYSFKITFTV